MSATNASDRSRKRPAVVVLAALALAASGACSTRPDDAPASLEAAIGDGDDGSHESASCQTPAQGCPCAKDAAVIDCGKVIRKSGNYVTCSIGTRRCEHGAWGACIGDTLYDHVAPPADMPGGSGKPLDLGASGPCVANACDPYCFYFGDSPTGLSTPAGLTVDGNGLTLSANGGGPCKPMPPAPLLGNLQCFQAACGTAQGTTLSGTVTDPAGKLPLYDVLVYVPNAPLQPFAAGVAADTCDTIASGAPLTATLTDAAGAFTLANVPVGSGIPIVIQSGRWRRQFTVDVMNECDDNPIPGGVIGFPRSVAAAGPTPPCSGAGTASCGDIPQFAVVTGADDGMECLMRRMGIADSEFTAPGPLGTTWGNYQNGRVHVYTHNGGYVAPQTAFTALYGSPAMLRNYQAVVSACTGFTWNFAGYGLAIQNMVDYANLGGRLFTSHFNSWALIEQAPAASLWPMTANWDPYGPGFEPTTWTINGVPTPAAEPLAVTVDTSFPQGAAFNAWLGNVGALAGGKLPVYDWAHVANSVNAPFGLQWLGGNTQYQYPTLGGSWCIFNGIYSGCTPDDSSYCGCGGWKYVVNPWLGPYTPGAGPDAVAFTFETPLNKPPYAGRVLESAMHTSQGSSGAFPSYCSAAPLNAQEKALEFLLFQNTSCAMNSSGAPVLPPPSYNVATYTRDYHATCGPETCPVWRFFDYATIDPGDSSIDFSAQTAIAQAGLGGAPSVSLGRADAGKPNSPTSAPFPNDAGAALAAAGQKSQEWLRVTMTLNPSSNHQQAPTLEAWQQSYSCMPCE